MRAVARSARPARADAPHPGQPGLQTQAAQPTLVQGDEPRAAAKRNASERGAAAQRTADVPPGVVGAPAAGARASAATAAGGRAGRELKVTRIGPAPPWSSERARDAAVPAPAPESSEPEELQACLREACGMSALQVRALWAGCCCVFLPTQLVAASVDFLPSLLVAAPAICCESGTACTSTTGWRASTPG